MRASTIPILETEKSEALTDLESFKHQARSTQSSSPETYQLSGEVLTQEKELDRVLERRVHVRTALEHVKRRLPINVELILNQDLKEAEELCQTLKKMDRDQLLVLMRQRDEAKKTWLSNFLQGELQSLLASDRHDMQSHITSQTADFEKLAKLVAKLGNEGAALQ